MTARDEERDRRRLDLAARSAVGVEQVGADVTDEVVDGVERDAERGGEALRRADADHQGPGEARAARHGDRLQLVETHLCGPKRLDERRSERFEVGTGRDLGHDTAVAGVLVHRRGDDVRQEARSAHDPDARLIAARLDPEHEGSGTAHSGPSASIDGMTAPESAGSPSSSRMTTASTPSGW